MSKYEWAAIFVSVMLGFLKLSIELLQEMHWSFSNFRQNFKDALTKTKAASVVETVMLALVLAVLLKVVTTTLPKVENSASRTEHAVVRLERKIADEVEPRMARLERGLETYVTLTDADPLQEILRQVALAARSVPGIPDNDIRTIWTQQFEWAATNFRKELVSIRSNRILIPRDLVQKFGELVIANAKGAIDATSYVSPDQWWTTPEGELYLRKNAEAIQRGVRIRRIFVYKNGGERRGLDEIIGEQKKVGIDVYLCDVNRLPQSLRKDLIIMDNKLSGELGITEDRDFNTVLVSKDPVDVQDAVRRWNDLLRLSSRF